MAQSSAAWRMMLFSTFHHKKRHMPAHMSSPYFQYTRKVSRQSIIVQCIAEPCTALQTRWNICCGMCRLITYRLCSVDTPDDVQTISVREILLDISSLTVTSRVCIRATPFSVHYLFASFENYWLRTVILFFLRVFGLSNKECPLLVPVSRYLLSHERIDCRCSFDQHDEFGELMSRGGGIAFAS